MIDSRRLLRWMLPLLVCELAFIVYAVWYAHRHGYWGYLPPPILYDAIDHFMDFFNTNFWAFREGRYSKWGSIYPLFVFLVGRLVGSEQCAGHDPFTMRSCDFSSLWLIAAAYLIGIAACTWNIVRFVKRTDDRSQWAIGTLVFFALALALPGLFALQRANYILLAFGCVALAAALEWNLASALLLAVAINLKPYLVLLWLPFLFSKRFRFVAWSMLFALVLDGLARVFVKEDSYSLVFENMWGFAASTHIGYFEKLWYPTTLSAWSRAIEGSSRFLLVMRGGWFSVIHWTGFFLRLVVLLAAGSLTLAALLRIRTVGTTYVCFCVMLALLACSDTAGGYGLLFLLPFIAAPLQRTDLKWVPWLLFAILVPLDYTIGPYMPVTRQDPFTGQEIHRIVGLGLGSYLRPIVIFGFVVYLLRDFYRTWKSESPENAGYARSGSDGAAGAPRTEASKA